MAKRVLASVRTRESMSDLIEGGCHLPTAALPWSSWQHL